MTTAAAIIAMFFTGYFITWYTPAGYSNESLLRDCLQHCGKCVGNHKQEREHSNPKQAPLPHLGLKAVWTGLLHKPCGHLSIDLKSPMLILQVGNWRMYTSPSLSFLPLFSCRSSQVTKFKQKPHRPASQCIWSMRSRVYGAVAWGWGSGRGMGWGKWKTWAQILPLCLLVILHSYLIWSS